MKKFTGLLLLLVLTVLSCSKYDDSEIWDYVKGLNTRLTTLEEKCKEMNTNISSLQTLVGAVENGDYITNVAPVTKDGNTIGYTISFHKSQAITIYNGTDGYAPVIGVKKDVDGLYYWTIDGEWLKDGEGHKVQASGTNGENGTTPQLKIENEYWYVSYDSGATWQILGKATGPKGDEGESLFSSVEIGTNEVTFVLADGTSFSIPLNNSSTGGDETPDDHEWVDLGLPSGTLWATYNVGANNTDVYGHLFAWGDTEWKYNYSWSNYSWVDGDGWTNINKYTYADNMTEARWYRNGVFIGDGITELLPEDDIATHYWGSNWQMPSAEQCQELIDNNYTTTIWTKRNGVDGTLISSKRNGQSLFMPVVISQHFVGGSDYFVDSGMYWSRTLSFSSAYAYCLLLHFKSDTENVVGNDPRWMGRAVRPVRKQ